MRPMARIYSANCLRDLLERRWRTIRYGCSCLRYPLMELLDVNDHKGIVRFSAP